MIKLNGKEIKFETFPNGETRMVDEGIALLDWGKQTISFKYENDSDLIKLMFVKKFVDSRRKSSSIFELIIYYMPYSRMDRSEDGSAFTLKYVADFINSLDFDKVTVVEPHSDVTLALLNNVESKFVNFKLLPKVMEEVKFLSIDYLFFPDAGAPKRYANIKGYNQLVGFKNRDFKNRRN